MTVVWVLIAVNVAAIVVNVLGIRASRRERDTYFRLLADLDEFRPR